LSELNKPFSPGEIWEARKRLKPYIYSTPLLFSTGLSQITGCEIYLKMECWQLCGCFKVRGAINMVASLSEGERRRELVTCSSGNHGAAVSFATNLFRGAKAIVFVPRKAEKSKLAKIKSYGAEIIPYGQDFLMTLDRALEYAEEGGGIFIHSHGHPLIIAGQGTIGLEILEDIPDVEVVVVPIGGGGLISGILTALKSANEKIRVFGVESSAAPGAQMSYRDGYCHERIQIGASIADGLMGTLTPLTFELTHKRVEKVVAVNDDQIVQAMRLFQEEEQLTVEPSAAVSLAAIISGEIDIRNKKTVLVVTGRNISWERYQSLLTDGISPKQEE